MKLIKTKVYKASFTIEATWILGIVFVTIAILIRQAYLEYDRVTGTMILEETLVKFRCLKEEEFSVTEAENYGEFYGNPRLWLGEYQLEIQQKGGSISGTASAGSWSQEMKIKQFYPGDYLRKSDVFRAFIGNEEGFANGEDGVQKRNEPELSGAASEQRE